MDNIKGLKRAAVFLLLSCNALCSSYKQTYTPRAQEVFEFVQKYDQEKAHDYAQLVENFEKRNVQIPREERQNAKREALRKKVQRILTEEYSHAVLYLMAALCAQASMVLNTDAHDALWRIFVVLLEAERAWRNFVDAAPITDFDFVKILTGPNFVHDWRHFLPVAGSALSFGSKHFFYGETAKNISETTHCSSETPDPYGDRAVKKSSKNMLCVSNHQKVSGGLYVDPADSMQSTASLGENPVVTPKGTGVHAWVHGSRHGLCAKP